MARDVLHVVPQNEQWAVKREGHERADTTHDTQKEAIESARETAKDGDDIVIHRPDGTIRGRLSYTENSNPQRTGTRERREGEAVKTHDLVSVGKRVSWSALLAGAVVTIAVYATLMSLAVAIGLTTWDHIENMAHAYIITAGVVALFSMLVALFLGGMVASRTTVGEDKLESLIYGVLLWGALFVFATLVGTNMMGAAGNMALGFGALANIDPEVRQQVTGDRMGELKLTAEQQKEYEAIRAEHAGPLTPEQLARLDLTPQQQRQYDALTQAAGAMQAEIGPAGIAWIAFASMILTIIAAIAGAVVGAGPELVLKQFRERQQLIVLRPAGANGAEVKARS